MNLDQILASIKEHYPDKDIAFLCDRLAAGDMSARKQLADKVSVRPAKLPPLVHLEIAKWGITDDLSAIEEIRHGGARPGSGRKPLQNPATIYIKLEMEDKTAFVRAAQKSKEGNLSQWMIAAAREKLERGK